MTSPDRTGRAKPWLVRHAPTERLAAVADRHPERGAIMILALAFLTVVLTLTLAVLSLADVGARSLKTFRLERVRRYSADAALQSAVQYLKDNPDLGVSVGSPGSCDTTYTMQQDTAAGEAFSVVSSSGSVLNVVCTPTPGVVSGGTDSDGGQAARDVTFEVQCQTTGSTPGFTPMDCAPGGADTRVLARARVRFDVDYGIVPTAPDCNAGCTASTVRAVVPKAITWSTAP